MKEKRLEQRAEEYANEKCKDCYMCNYSECENPYKECKKYIERKKGYIAGATEKDEQLTNAKELIKKLRTLYFNPVVTNDDVKRQNEILAEAEQFLGDEK